MRFGLALIVAALIAAPIPAADTKLPQSGVESLGSELLDGLAPNMLRPAPPSPLDDAGRSQPAARDPASPQPRFDDLGKDISQPSGPLSLVRVRQGMKQAESLLAEPAAATDAGTLHDAATVQQQVVDQLDKLIGELSKQCQGGQCQPSDQPPKPSQRSQTKPGDSAGAAGRGRTAARDSTARLNQASSQPVDKADLEALIKDLWGHLPQRSREQMQQSFSDEFLPKYELEIEQYYRRLSEDYSETPALK